MSQDGLESKMFAEPQIIKNLGSQFTILAHGGMDRNASLESGAEGCVNESTVGNELIQRVARAQVDIVKAFGGFAIDHRVFVWHLQFQRHEAESLLEFELA